MAYAGVKHLVLNHYLPSRLKNHLHQDFANEVSKTFRGKITSGYYGCEIIF